MKKLLALATSLILSGTAGLAYSPVGTIPPGWPSKTEGRLIPNLQATDRVVFAGDSVTYLGQQPGGWIPQMQAFIAQKHPELNGITFYGSGVSGDTTQTLYARFNNTVLDVQPTVVVIWIGIHEIDELNPGKYTACPYFGTGPHDTYTLTSYGNWMDLFVTMCKNCPSVREIVLITPMCSGEKYEGQNVYDQMIDTMSQTVKDAAWSNQVPCIDIRTDWIAAEKQYNTKDVPYGIITSDGTHPQPNTWGASEVAYFFESGFGL
jgi:lysophospholipase L1-like esterase